MSYYTVGTRQVSVSAHAVLRDGGRVSLAIGSEYVEIDADEAERMAGSLLVVAETARKAIERAQRDEDDRTVADHEGEL